MRRVAGVCVLLGVIVTGLLVVTGQDPDTGHRLVVQAVGPFGVAVAPDAEAFVEPTTTTTTTLPLPPPTTEPPPPPPPPPAPVIRNNGAHSDAWWQGVAVCEQGGQNNWYYGYFSIMDGSAGGKDWATQVAMANAIIAHYGDGAWAASCVAAGYRASPGG